MCWTRCPDRPVTFNETTRGNRTPRAFPGSALPRAAIPHRRGLAPLAHRARTDRGPARRGQNLPRSQAERARIRGLDRPRGSRVPSLLLTLPRQWRTGASAFSEENLLCGIVRDIHTASRHAMGQRPDQCRDLRQGAARRQLEYQPRWCEKPEPRHISHFDDPKPGARMTTEVEPTAPRDVTRLGR